MEPTPRDVILGGGSAGHETNMLLQDMMRLHRIRYKLQSKKSPETAQEAAEIAQQLYELVQKGKAYQMAGLKDVPKPFMKSPGRFLEKEDNHQDNNNDEPTTSEADVVWRELTPEQAQTALANALVEEFKMDDLGDLTTAPYQQLQRLLALQDNATEDDAADKDTAVVIPQPTDAILLPVNNSTPSDDKLYEQQGGNKTIFHLSSQLVTNFTTTPDKRVEAALLLLQGLQQQQSAEMDKSMEKEAACRILVREAVPTEEEPPQEEQPEADTTTTTATVNWKILKPFEAAQFAVLFCFEVFLEKGIHLNAANAAIAAATADETKPGAHVVEDPVESDVLFGRGGMTNSHPGNRRFRDIIALHRPDYIRAIKMDKPGVARKIVKAIRLGNPPGRFLKKAEDGKWYDVGDRTAAEKTSQGLRERSNAEKRQRSALREALRIRKQDIAEPEEGDPKKQKIDGLPGGLASIPTLNYVGTNLPVPLSLNMKEQTVKKRSEGATGSSSELNTEGLPPNAVDEEGNILVTDYDILCGRGGLTNHHKGNKRFRDIVALHRPDYVRAPKIQKPSVARVIVRAIRNGDPPGRFLRKDEKTGQWFEIGDKKAAEKTSQALREKTNEERDRLKTDPASLGVQILLPNPSSYLAAVTGAPLVLPGMHPPLGLPGAKTDDGKLEAKQVGDKKPDVTSELSAEAAAVVAATAAEAIAKATSHTEAETKAALEATPTSVANPVAQSAQEDAEMAEAAQAAAAAVADPTAKGGSLETMSV